MVDAADVEVSRELLEFIRRSPSMFHTVATLREMLDTAGFACLPEGEPWDAGELAVKPGGAYYAVRNNSSIVAFRVGEDVAAQGGGYHFQIAAAHSDSPTFKVKAVPGLEGPGGYVRLNVEAYGGVIDSTWFDRPLGLAGRVLVRAYPGRIESRLINVDRDVALIPNLCIHFDRGVNAGKPLNRQIDLCPLFSAGELGPGDFDKFVADAAGCAPHDLLARDLFLVNRQEGRVWGAAEEFVSSPKLDDLQCAFAAAQAFLACSEGANPASVNVLAVFDNEEVGSNTKQGAMSTFLHDVLVRTNAALGKSQEDYLCAQARSFLVSCDNAHAVHPNLPAKTDERNCAYLNRGIVIKEAANQKYTTDAFSRAVFEDICELIDVPTQSFANRSDTLGGSTLGNLSNTQVSVHAVDIGLPQLAMHSSYETAGTRDTAYAICALKAFYETDIRIDGADAASW